MPKYLHASVTMALQLFVLELAPITLYPGKLRKTWPHYSAAGAATFSGALTGTSATFTDKVVVSNSGTTDADGYSLAKASADAQSLRTYHNGTNWVIAPKYGTQGGLSDLHLQASTGNTAGLLINRSTGNVGIGTTGPGKELHVYSGASGVGASSDVNMILEGASNVGLAMLAPNNQGSRDRIWQRSGQ